MTKQRPIIAASAIVLALTAWLVVGTATAASAVTVTGASGFFTVSADDGNIPAGARITGYTGAGGAVVIPNTVVIGPNTYNVTSIGPNAFDNKGLTSVTIPATVTDIENQAFVQDHLSAVSLPAGLTNIGSGAFSLNSLTTVTIPAGVTDLTFASFDGNNLTSVTFAGSPTTIGQSAFANNDFTSFTIPASVTSIGLNAFIQNSNLTSITFAGAAPTTFSSAGPSGSFGTAVGRTVFFHWAFGVPQAAGGFTTPAWNGYATTELVTVNFDMQGHGSAPADQVFASGGTATQPAAPTAAGQTFTGWFTSAALTTPFDFAAPVTADATAFAGWTTSGATSGGTTSAGLAATGVTISPLLIVIVAGVLILGVLLLLISRLRSRRAAHED